jgi:hypothetical protein
MLSGNGKPLASGEGVSGMAPWNQHNNLPISLPRIAEAIRSIAFWYHF